MIDDDYCILENIQKVTQGKITKILKGAQKAGFKGKITVSDDAVTFVTATEASPNDMDQELEEWERDHPVSN